jgi:hypothetical protein
VVGIWEIEIFLNFGIFISISFKFFSKYIFTIYLFQLTWAESSSELIWSPVVRRPSGNIYIFDFFSRTTGPILTRLGTNHPLINGIQVCSKEGDSPSQRGDNSERVKIHWKFLKIFFSRTSWPNSIKLITHYPWVTGIQVCSNKGPSPLQRGDNHKNVKMGGVI